MTDSAPPNEGVGTPPEMHEYLPSSRWTGYAGYPRWAVCVGCGFVGPQRTLWRQAEADYRKHLQLPGAA